MTEIVQTRRRFLGAAALGASAGLAGCAGIFPGTGVSSHAGRRKTGSSARPLVFVPAAGLSAVNVTRRKFALQTFQHDSRLQKAAQNHANYMARTGKFGHEFGPGTYFPQRIAAVGFDGSAGENLGVGYGSVDEAIEGWLNSPKHRKIMLRRKYNRAGIAYAFNRSGKNPRYTHFWVLVVGKSGPSGSAPGRFMRRT